MNRIITAVLKLFFQLLYHQFAWLYDLVANLVSLGRWKDWVLATLPFIRGPRILEIGHGPGHLQAAMAASGLSAVGLDASPQMGKIASRRMTKLAYTPRLVNGYAQFLPFPNRVFDTILATFPTEYIFEPICLSEITRILKPDGVLLVLPAAVIDSARPLDRLFAWLFRITRQAPGRLDSAYIDSISLPFKQAGFELEPRIISIKNSQVLLLVGRQASRAAAHQISHG